LSSRRTGKRMEEPSPKTDLSTKNLLWRSFYPFIFLADYFPCRIDRFARFNKRCVRIGCVFRRGNACPLWWVLPIEKRICKRYMLLLLNGSRFTFSALSFKASSGWKIQRLPRPLDNIQGIHQRDALGVAHDVPDKIFIDETR